MKKIDIKDISHTPELQEISDYIENPLFDQFCEYMDREYKALRKIEYSKDTWAKGWNVKLRKAGKGLCVIYPREHYFTVLVVVGNKEREAVEELLPQLSDDVQKIYHETKEGNGQRWLMIDLYTDDVVYEDTLKLICIRRRGRY